jgi:hypothetical protein
MRLSLQAPEELQDPAGKHHPDTRILYRFRNRLSGKKTFLLFGERDRAGGGGVKDGAPVAAEAEAGNETGVVKGAGSVQGAGTGAFPGVKAGTRVEAVASVAAGFSAFQYGARHGCARLRRDGHLPAVRVRVHSSRVSC